eukprot:NODE_3666_length_1308_cov_68.871730_g3206_i0.p1 GENE.NODE_3666_length_1308_cov_68.871730_g3206_i0~~NODE_3666_length_1308_cov_68.871730_g3206_i0.p1  ORF type:complete len:362 (-),score=81.36 NODE_3666_length_1308_cov_68.871730_g3206_i0:129-1214(-)
MSDITPPNSPPQSPLPDTISINSQNNSPLLSPPPLFIPPSSSFTLPPAVSPDQVLSDDSLSVSLNTPTSPNEQLPRPCDLLVVQVGPPSHPTTFTLNRRDIIAYPDSLLAHYYHNRENWKQGETFDRNPIYFANFIKPFYEKGIILLNCPAESDAAEQEFGFFGLPYDYDKVILPKIGDTICFRFHQYVARMYQTKMKDIMRKCVRDLKGSHEFTVQELGMEAVEPDFFQRVFSSPPYCFNVICKFEKRHGNFVNIFEVSIPSKPVEGSEACILAAELNQAIDISVQALVKNMLNRRGEEWLASAFIIQQAQIQTPDRYCTDIIKHKLITEHNVHVEDWGVSPFTPSSSIPCPHCQSQTSH